MGSRRIKRYNFVHCPSCFKYLVVMRFSLAFSLFLTVITRSEAQRVCGNYCGPAWCDGKHLKEDYCDDSVKPTGPADACCRLHDFCCGHQNDTSSCNRMIIACLAKVDKADTTCTRPSPPVPVVGNILPPVIVPPSVIEGAMSIAADWCCSHPCKAHSAAASQMDLLVIKEDAIKTDLSEKEREVASSVSTRWEVLALAGCAAATLALAMASIARRRQDNSADYVSLLDGADCPAA